MVEANRYNMVELETGEEEQEELLKLHRSSSSSSCNFQRHHPLFGSHSS